MFKLYLYLAEAAEALLEQVVVAEVVIFVHKQMLEVVEQDHQQVLKEEQMELVHQSDVLVLLAVEAVVQQVDLLVMMAALVDQVAEHLETVELVELQ